MEKTERVRHVEPDETEGHFLLINKPRGLTSFDVVHKVRRILRVRKAGHAGTLDPLASGLLIVCTSRRTKEIARFQDLEKEYRVIMILGAVTPSYDAETEPTEQRGCDGITDEKIHSVAGQFVGHQLQSPPLYSAVKLHGRRLYRYARRGIEVQRPPRDVFIRSIRVCRVDLPTVEMIVVCSKGTYIRSLVHEMGQVLGCGAYVQELERTKIGGFRLIEALTLEQLEASFPQETEIQS